MSSRSVAATRPPGLARSRTAAHAAGELLRLLAGDHAEAGVPQPDERELPQVRDALADRLGPEGPRQVAQREQPAQRPRGGVQREPDEREREQPLERMAGLRP